jgi:arylsulfatase A-like enzyme
MLDRRFFLKVAGATALRAANQRTNILLITADNLGYGDLGCFGNRVIQTPNLDRFARQGVRFTNFYTASPTCTASRAALLTGRHPIRYGLNYQLSAEENKRGIGLRHSEKLIPQYLKPHGYTTACFGKWNLGFAPGSRPSERGFDEFLGHRSGNMDYYTHLYNGDPDLYHGTEPAKVQGYCTDLFADAAGEFLRRKAATPFFLYLPFNAPHYPNPRNLRPGEKLEWQAPAKYFRLYGYRPDEPDQTKRYHAVVTALDDAFGRVLRQLDRLGLASRTLVIFYSDNGAFMTPGHGREVASNAPWRDGGATCWEGGIRVPGMARWPGRIPAGRTCAELQSSLDLLPLVLSASGVPVPRDAVLDGHDPLPVLQGKARSPHETLCFEYRRYQAVRSDHWKLLRAGTDLPWQLFDLQRDLGESADVAKRFPEIVRKLASQFETWRKSVDS